MAQAELGPAAGDAGLRAELCVLGEGKPRETNSNSQSPCSGCLNRSVSNITKSPPPICSRGVLFESLELSGSPDQKSGVWRRGAHPGSLGT